MSPMISAFQHTTQRTEREKTLVSTYVTYDHYFKPSYFLHDHTLYVLLTPPPPAHDFGGIPYIGGGETRRSGGHLIVPITRPLDVLTHLLNLCGRGGRGGDGEESDEGAL